MTFLMWGTMQRGPGPSPTKVPSITANTPRWIRFWIISRSTRVSWMTGWVQWRGPVGRPPKGVFISPGGGGEEGGVHVGGGGVGVAEEPPGGGGGALLC